MNAATVAPITPAPPSDARQPIEFVQVDQPHHLIIIQAPWDWLRIQQLLNTVLSLSNISSVKTQSIDPHSLRDHIRVHLPESKAELQRIIRLALKYQQRARLGSPREKQILGPYLEPLRQLKWAAREKLAGVFCQTNWRHWDLRAYRLFQEMQYNLGRLPRLHFLTLTIRGNVCYRSFRERIKKLKRKLNGMGLGMFPLISLHPENGRPGRLHAHAIVWSLRNHTARHEKSLVERIKEYLKSKTGPFGRTDWKTCKTPIEKLQILAYFAQNYSDTLRAPRGDDQVIPKKSRVISPPKEAKEGVGWQRVGPVSLVTPAATEWRKAVGLYASMRGRRPGSDCRWIWRERHRIRNLITPECWASTSVTGLDGYTYRVQPAGLDALDQETYSISSDERGTFFLTEDGLQGLARLQVAPGALPKNPKLDPTTGVTAYCYEVLGF